MSAESVLVQTRLTEADARWLRDSAHAQGLSASGMLRKIVVEARKSEKVTFDAAALEARLIERLEALAERVRDLEGQGS